MVVNVYEQDKAQGTHYPVGTKRTRSEDAQDKDDRRSRIRATLKTDVKTRQHSYRKEDRAMRPIYGCPEKFSESSLCTWLLFQKFVMDFCSDRY